MGLPKQEGYRQALEIGCGKLQKMDLPFRAEQGEFSFSPETGMEITCFNKRYLINPEDCGFESPDESVISLVTRIVILHYILAADGFPLSKKFITYGEIPGGLTYAGVFRRRVIMPFLSTFGEDLEGFKKTAESLKGIPALFGDAAYTFQIFPRTPVTLVLWAGDEEFPPAGKMLFDASIDHYLSLEDVVVMGEMIVGRMKAAFQAPGP
jgi:hypothetical protein